MKWLNKYNNILFAVLGTLSIIVLLVVAISSLSLFSDSGPDNRGIDQEPVSKDGIKTPDDEEVVEYLLGDPENVDTSMSIYIIPVYKPETDKETGKFSSSYRSNLITDLIIHDFQNNSYNRLFNSVVLINYYEIIKTSKEIFITVIYSDEDTNSNNIIDFDDKKSIGLYDLNEEAFQTIPLNNKYVSISSIYDRKLSAIIIIGTNYLPNKQPSYQYYKYLLETQKVQELGSPM